MRMKWMAPQLPVWVALAAAALAVTACGADEPPAQSATPPAAMAPAAVPSAEAPAEQATLEPTAQSWTPEALEELLAPVALYPDIVIGQVLVASTNPQEVLDAGNWLLKNQNLEGSSLDEAAKKVGFTPPVRVLLQTPTVVDMMCMEMGWTTELGQAFVNDQIGVLDAVQRLRAQAKAAGNLVSSDQLKVETEVQNGTEVITVSPPNEKVVYVPQYDPVAVYAPAPAPVAATAPATTTTTTTTEGHSTGTLVATGLLSFGAGLLVGEIFDDDDWDDDYWRGPNYYGGGMPYYPPYPYRPAYGGGNYPSHGYNRPPNYQNGFNNNTVVNVNTGNQSNDYWNRYDNKQAGGAGRNKPSSPITAARGNRPELNSLNERAKAGPVRGAPTSQEAWKGRNSYAGATQQQAQRPGQQGAQSPGQRETTRNAPKVQGSYAGASRPSRPAGQPTTTTRPSTSAQRPASTDRGREAASGAATGRPATTSRPAAPAQQRPTTQQRSTAQQRPQSQQRPQTQQRSQGSGISGVNRGSADRAASQRGRESTSRQSASRQGASRQGGGGRSR